MAKLEKPKDGLGYMPEISAVLQAGQMPKAFSPASLPDIDVTPAIEAARMIADVAVAPRPEVADPAAGRRKSGKPPNRE